MINRINTLARRAIASCPLKASVVNGFYFAAMAAGCGLLAEHLWHGVEAVMTTHHLPIPTAGIATGLGCFCLLVWLRLMNGQQNGKTIAIDVGVVVGSAATAPLFTWLGVGVVALVLQIGMLLLGFLAGISMFLAYNAITCGLVAAAILAVVLSRKCKNQVAR